MYLLQASGRTCGVDLSTRAEPAAASSTQSSATPRDAKRYRH